MCSHAALSFADASSIAFIEYGSLEDSKRAIEEMHGQAFHGRSAVVRYAKERGSRPQFATQGGSGLRNAPTKLMKSLGHGKAYRYAHDEPEGYAAGETYLPEGIVAPGWYRPVARGLEARIAEKLQHLKELDEASRR